MLEAALSLNSALRGADVGCVQETRSCTYGCSLPLLFKGFTGLSGFKSDINQFYFYHSNVVQLSEVRCVGGMTLFEALRTLMLKPSLKTFFYCKGQNWVVVWWEPDNTLSSLPVIVEGREVKDIVCVTDYSHFLVCFKDTRMSNSFSHLKVNGACVNLDGLFPPATRRLCVFAYPPVGRKVSCPTAAALARNTWHFWGKISRTWLPGWANAWAPSRRTTPALLLLSSPTFARHRTKWMSCG